MDNLVIILVGQTDLSQVDKTPKRVSWRDIVTFKTRTLRVLSLRDDHFQMRPITSHMATLQKSYQHINS